MNDDVDYALSMEKTKDILYNDLLDDLYFIREVDFNSDVINSEYCIFFPKQGNMFTLIRYPADGKRLPVTIIHAIELFDRECYSRPRFVLIPFSVYATYASRGPQFPEDLPTPSLDYVCKEFGLEYKVMIPDRLKENVKGTTDYAKWHI